MSLKAIRAERGYTLKKLAELSGLNYVKIHYIESGKINPENIQLKTALKLARALKCSPEDLLDEVTDNASI